MGPSSKLLYSAAGALDGLAGGSFLVALSIYSCKFAGEFDWV